MIKAALIAVVAVVVAVAVGAVAMTRTDGGTERVQAAAAQPISGATDAVASLLGKRPSAAAKCETGRDDESNVDSSDDADCSADGSDESADDSSDEGSDEASDDASDGR
jgi:hypothetical protein